MADRVVIMSKGEIAQIGSARDIYRTPANRFVAEFVGRNNILSGTAKPGNRVETPAGTFLVGDEVAPATAVTFVVAADLVAISKQAPEAPNVIQAQLISEEFVGSMVTLFLEAPGGIELKVQVQERALDAFTPEPGETVYLSFDPGRAHVLKG